MRALFAFLFLVAACGFGWLGFQAMKDRETAAAPLAPPQSAAETTPVALAFAETRPTRYSALAERPLFSAVRRPPPPEAPGTPLADPADDLLLGRYEIAGVVMLGDTAMAMLRDETGRLIRIRAGDSVATRTGTASVIEITLTALTFEEAGEKVVAKTGDPETGVEGSQGQ